MGSLSGDGRRDDGGDWDLGLGFNEARFREADAMARDSLLQLLSRCAMMGRSQGEVPEKIVLDFTF